MARNRRRNPLSREPVELSIEKLSHEGRGISYVDGKVVFVDEALPGERVIARYTAMRDSFNEAGTLEVLSASAERVTPACEFAAICGGCSLQHFYSPAQISFKEQVLHEKLQHSIGREDYRHLDVITGPQSGYRRKARLGVRYVHKKEKVLVGFREKKSAFITDMDSCQVLDSKVSGLIPELSLLIAGMQDMRSIPQIEVAVGDSCVDANSVAFVIRHLRPLTEADNQRLLDFAAAHKIDLYLQPGGNDSVHRIYPEQGEERLYYYLPQFSLSMAFHPMDFTQVNAEMNNSMLDKAMELLHLNAEDRVLDLFCGLGNFTLPMARYCCQVTGVEGDKQMVQRGYENASRNGVENVNFHCADLSLSMIEAPWLQGGFSKVVVDPPRSGALEILQDIVSLRPERLLYISCNPATLARDASILETHGLKLKAAGVLDMFPQTTHVESIALFQPDQ
ncbi:MAG: 23S rRNA (uracil(1939)-C(5))-methyltransferase RlmD [Pseudohongiellaceae bacterium]